METGELVYFDLDDLIDIAEYYHINGDFELSNAVADYCLQLYPDNSAALLFKARLALIDFNDTQAATKLLEGVDMSSENIDVVCTMAEINIREGDIDKAEECLQRHHAIMIERGDDTVTPSVMGTEYDEEEEEEGDDGIAMPDELAMEAAMMYIDCGYVDMAEQWINRLSETYDVNVTEYYDIRAKIYMARRQWAEAEKMLDRMIDLDAFRYDAWLMIGDVQFQQSRYCDALQSAEYAIAISPNQPEAHHIRGNCLYAVGDFEGAQNCFERMLSICPGDPVAELLLLSTLFCRKMVGEAYKVADRLLRHVDEMSLQQKAETLRLCASVFAKADDVDKAMECCDMLEDCGAPQVDVQLARGAVCLGVMRLSDALGYFSNAMETAEYTTDILARIGGLLYDSGSVHLAYMLLKTLLEQFEDGDYVSAPAQALAYMAGASRVCGTRQEYLRYLECSVKLSPLDTACVLCDYFPKGTEPSQYLEIEKNRESC